MTSRETRAIAESQFGDEMLDRQARLRELRRALPPARDPSSLVEEAAIFGLGPGQVALDIGSGRGEWSARLAERFGCTSIAFDVSRSRLRDACERGLPSVRADGDGLPVRSGAVDVVWCRDTLEMFEDPVAALREFARVLVPGGGCVLYLPVPTELLEAGERAEMLAGRETAEWWMGGRVAVDDAIRTVGFEVLRFSITSPEYTESVLGRDPAAGRRAVDGARAVATRPGRDGSRGRRGVVPVVSDLVALADVSAARKVGVGTLAVARAFLGACVRLFRARRGAGFGCVRGRVLGACGGASFSRRNRKPPCFQGSFCYTRTHVPPLRTPRLEGALRRALSRISNPRTCRSRTPRRCSNASSTIERLGRVGEDVGGAARRRSGRVSEQGLSFDRRAVGQGGRDIDRGREAGAGRVEAARGTRRPWRTRCATGSCRRPRPKRSRMRRASRRTPSEQLRRDRAAVNTPSSRRRASKHARPATAKQTTSGSRRNGTCARGPTPKGPGTSRRAAPSIKARGSGCDRADRRGDLQERPQRRSARTAGCVRVRRAHAGRHRKNRKQRRTKPAKPKPQFLGLVRLDYTALVRGEVLDGEVCEIAGLGTDPGVNRT